VLNFLYVVFSRSFALLAVTVRPDPSREPIRVADSRRLVVSKNGVNLLTEPKNP
jgi:hypothetical protein